MTNTDELIIDETNFDQYFFDARKNKPQHGQVLACFEAVAELMDGTLKQDRLNLLVASPKGGEFAPKLMQKITGASEEDSVKVAKEMTLDLLNGMDKASVLAKPYEFVCKMYYYTQKEYIPQNDRRWWSTSFIDMRFLNDQQDFVKNNNDNDK